MKFILRPCELADAAAISRLNSEEMGYSHPVAETEKTLEALLRDDTQLVIVAVSENIVIGYIHAADYRLLYATPSKNILGIAVHSHYRNKGIGSALLAEVERWAIDSGCSSVRLASGVERESAHNFYKKRGYIFIKQQLNFKKILKS